MAGQTAQQHDNRTDSDGSIAVFDHAVEAVGEADHAKGNDVVKQDDADGLPDVLRILHIGETENHLDNGINEIGRASCRERV